MQTLSAHYIHLHYRSMATWLDSIQYSMVARYSQLAIALSCTASYWLDFYYQPVSISHIGSLAHKEWLTIISVHKPSACMRKSYSSRLHRLLAQKLVP